MVIWGLVVLESPIIESPNYRIHKSPSHQSPNRPRSITKSPSPLQPSGLGDFSLSRQHARRRVHVRPHAESAEPGENPENLTQRRPRDPRYTVLCDLGELDREHVRVSGSPPDHQLARSQNPEVSYSPRTRPPARRAFSGHFSPTCRGTVVAPNPPHPHRSTPMSMLCAALFLLLGPLPSDNVMQ